MTVPIQTPYDQHTANGSTAIFAYNFLILDEDDIDVYLGEVLQSSGYSVTGVGASSGGTVVFTSNPTSNTVVTLVRNASLSRSTDYQTSGDFKATVVNTDFDKIWLSIQQLNNKIERLAPLFSEPQLASIAATRANYLLSFDSNGIPETSLKKSDVQAALNQYVSGVQSLDPWVTFSGTPTRISNNQFTLTGDQTNTFKVGTRLKLTDSTDLYSVVSAVAYTSFTTVTNDLDSGALSASLSAVAYSVADVTNKPISAHAVAFNAIQTGSVTRSVYESLMDLGLSVVGMGADNTGATDCTAKLTAAVATGLGLVFPDGTYMHDGLNITTDYQSITFASNVIFKANSNNIVLFYQSASWCEHKGRIRTDSNSKTGVWAGCVGPQDLTQTTTVTQNNFNTLPAMIGDSGLDEVWVLQCGPDVGGTDSGCFYNTFPRTRGNGAKRVVWFKDPPNAGGSGPNRNEFYDFRAGTGGGVGSNTGIQIDAGATNDFFGCDFEGVGSSGGTTPNATPRALYIKQSSAVSGVDNNHNKFFGGTYEANTADIVNENRTTEFHGVSYLQSKCTFTEDPIVAVGGSDASVVNQKALGMKQIDGVTVELDAITDISDTGKKWQVHTLTTSNVSHVGGAAVTSIAEQQSKYWQFSGFVFWSFRLQFQAANNNDVLITLPVAEEVNQYSLFSLVDEMKFVAITNDGVTEEITSGQFVTGTNQVKLTHSSAWDTAAANNKIFVSCLIYHKA